MDDKTPRPAPTPRRVFLHLVACVALALTLALGQLWSVGPLQRRGVRRAEIRFDLDRLNAQIRVLSAWFRRSRRRPRYSSRERLLILEYGDRYRLSAAALARDILVSPATLYRWRRLRREAALADGLQHRPRPVPPCRRICDNRRQLVIDMARAGFAGHRTIERHLRHQGERISARSIARFRKTPATDPPARPPVPQLKEAPVDPVEARLVQGPRDRVRPRLARLLRTLADVFAQAVASDTLRHLDDDGHGQPDDEDALTRSRRADQLAIMLARMTRIEPRHRPRYTDVERATILTLKSRCRLSNKALASFFLLDPGTLSEWTADVDRPERRRKPLVETLPDQDAAIAALADHLPDLPPRLRHTVDQTLAAIAAKILLRRPRLRRSRMRQTPISPAPRKRRLSPIRARYPNHYWTADLTTIELVRPFHLVTLMDLHSRDVLAWELFAGQPASCDVEELFEDAARRHGKPKHFVSDQGGQFMGDALGTALAAKGVDHRRGAVGQHGSIAIIERLWKTVKECLDLQTVRPSVPAILHERIARIVDYYNTKRPHQSLGNATPAEVYAGQLSLAADPKPAPRGWPGEPRPAPPFVIRHAFPDERRLPFLERTA